MNDDRKSMERMVSEYYKESPEQRFASLFFEVARRLDNLFEKPNIHWLMLKDGTRFTIYTDGIQIVTAKNGMITHGEGRVLANWLMEVTK
jgi:hypothetical protein